MTKLDNFQDGVMEHAIGLSAYPRLVGRYHTFHSYTNCYTCDENSEKWKEWLEKGYAVEELYKQFVSCYYVTPKGIKYLEEKYGIRITQEKEDVVNVKEKDND